MATLYLLERSTPDGPRVSSFLNYEHLVAEVSYTLQFRPQELPLNISIDDQAPDDVVSG